MSFAPFPSAPTLELHKYAAGAVCAPMPHLPPPFPVAAPLPPLLIAVSFALSPVSPDSELHKHAGGHTLPILGATTYCYFPSRPTGSRAYSGTMVDVEVPCSTTASPTQTSSCRSVPPPKSNRLSKSVRLGPKFAQRTFR